MSHSHSTKLLMNLKDPFIKINDSFTAKSKEIEENCFISNLTKQSIAVEAGDKISMKDLAKRHFVSPTTVNRVLKKIG